MKKELHKAYFALGLVSFFLGNYVYRFQNRGTAYAWFICFRPAAVFIRSYTGWLFFNTWLPVTWLGYFKKDFNPEHLYALLG